MIGAAALPLRADRALSRVHGLPDDVRAALLNATGSQSLTSCRQVLNATELELVDQLGLYLPEVRLLVQAVSRHVASTPPTAAGLLRGETTGRSSSSSAHHAVRPSLVAAHVLPTGLSPLDEHLGGGLPVRAVTELVGPAGAGKTQLCLAVAARALVAGAAAHARVVYVDTEGSFSARRLLQLLHALGAPATVAGDEDRRGRASATLPPAEELLRRLSVFRPTNWAEYSTCVREQLEDELLTPPHVALLVVDSVAMAVHRQFDRDGDLLRRQTAVGMHAARLKHYADAHATCVLCVNQVVGGSGGAHGPAAEGDVASVHGRDDAHLLAYLGTAWAHCVNVRLALQHPFQALQSAPPAPMPAPPAPGSVGSAPARPMVLKVAKAPMCAEASFAYMVGDTGLEAAAP